MNTFACPEKTTLLYKFKVAWEPMTGKLLKEMNDEELAEAMNSGYRDALGILYDKYASDLFGYINRIEENENEAERIFQIVFVFAWIEAKKFDAGKTNMLRWLMEIALSFTLKREKLAEYDRIQHTENFVSNKGNQSLNSLSLQVLSANLNERTKAVFELIYLSGTTVSQMAVLLGMETTEIQSLLRIAVNNLRRFNKHEYN
ncbi:hypothetical protein BH11BAC1_BH11BAC1_23600 [soil metagenome]